MPIVNRILQAFSNPEPAPLPALDAKHALGALMVRVAKSDSTYRVEEIQRIDRILARANHIGPIEAAQMRAICEKLEHAAPDTDEFARLIRETVSHEGRFETLKALWAVLLADGVERPEEVTTINALRSALGMSEADSNAARGAVSGG